MIDEMRESRSGIEIKLKARGFYRGTVMLAFALDLTCHAINETHGCNFSATFYLSPSLYQHINNLNYFEDRDNCV